MRLSIATLNTFSEHRTLFHELGPLKIQMSASAAGLHHSHGMAAPRSWTDVRNNVRCRSLVNETPLMILQRRTGYVEGCLIYESECAREWIGHSTTRVRLSRVYDVYPLLAFRSNRESSACIHCGIADLCPNLDIRPVRMGQKELSLRLSRPLRTGGYIRVGFPVLNAFHRARSTKRRQKLTDLSIPPTLCPERLFGIRHCPIQRFTSTRVLFTFPCQGLYPISFTFLFRSPLVRKFASGRAPTIHDAALKHPVVALATCLSTAC